jgi:hypothetical protein
LKIIASPRISTTTIPFARKQSGSSCQVMSHKIALTKINFTHLRVNDDTNVFAITDHFLEVIFNCLLAQIVSPLLAGLCESLLLARIPVILGLDDRGVNKKKEEKVTDLVDDSVHWRLLKPSHGHQNID